MSRRPQILASCLRLLACGPETTRDLSLHVGAPRALVAVALQGEPGVTREGDMWHYRPIARAPVVDADQADEAERAPRLVRGKPESQALTYLRNHPGWHLYASIAEHTGLAYTTVALALARNKSCLSFGQDSARRILVAWKATAVRA